MRRALVAGSWVVVGAAGFLLGRQIPTPVPVPEPVQEHVVPADCPPVPADCPPVPPVEPAPVEACVETHHCECPPPPPDDLDPRYAEDAVEAWLQSVLERCPDVAERELVVSCETFPCLVGISIDEDDAMKRHPELDATCGLSAEPAAPELVTVANTSLNDDWYVVFAVRPKALNDYLATEMTRARELMGR